MAISTGPTAWAGWPCTGRAILITNSISRGRSLGLETYPLCFLFKVELISLQKGPGSEQAEQGIFTGRWHSQQTSVNDAWGFKCCRSGAAMAS